MSTGPVRSGRLGALLPMTGPYDPMTEPTGRRFAWIYSPHRRAALSTKRIVTSITHDGHAWPWDPNACHATHEPARSVSRQGHNLHIDLHIAKLVSSSAQRPITKRMAPFGCGNSDATRTKIMIQMYTVANIFAASSTSPAAKDARSCVTLVICATPGFNMVSPIMAGNGDQQTGTDKHHDRQQCSSGPTGALTGGSCPYSQTNTGRTRRRRHRVQRRVRVLACRPDATAAPDAALNNDNIHWPYHQCCTTGVGSRRLRSLDLYSPSGSGDKVNVFGARFANCKDCLP